MVGRLVRSALHLTVVVLLGGFAAAALVRYSPGFDVDENAWNPRAGASAREALAERRAAEAELPRFYVRYLVAAAHGDFGVSEAYRVPVAELLRDRAPVTGRLILAGAGGGFLLAALLAWVAVWPRTAGLELAASGISSFLLAIPPAVLALAFFFREAPIAAALGLAVMPRLFGSLRAMLRDAYESTPLLAARARGVGPFTLGFRYVVGPITPRLFALAALAVVIAFGSSIPVESLCDVPGIGQLAWKAALARDLPLLSALALIVTFVVASVQTLGDLAG